MANKVDETPTTHQNVLDQRIPIDCFNPGWHYAICVDRESAAITDVEATMLRSYLDYMCEDFYGSPFAELLARWNRAAPYLAIPGHNTVTFRKREDGDWGYRRMTWDRGPLFYPQPSSGHGERMDLAELLDHLNCHYSKWEAWKTAHPGLAS
jgi:hypothetical protein